MGPFCLSVSSLLSNATSPSRTTAARSLSTVKRPSEIRFLCLDANGAQLVTAQAPVQREHKLLSSTLGS